MPSIIKSVIVFSITCLLFSCKVKYGTGQWNLNSTIGWGGENMDDYTVLFVKWNEQTKDPTLLDAKKEFDDKILKLLKSNKLGEQAENDSDKETDLHFLVSKDYEKVLTAIRRVAKTEHPEQKITVHRREYKSWDKWDDKVVFKE